MYGKSDETFGILTKTEGGGALENPDMTGAEGAKGEPSPRISQAKGQSGHILCLFVIIFQGYRFRWLLFF